MTGRIRAVCGALFVAASALAVTSIERLVWIRSTLHMDRARVDPARAAQVRAEFPTLRDVSFETSDGLTLRGWFVPGSRPAAVIFVHGGGGNRLELLPDARVAIRHGFGVLLYDSRASGESDGTLITWGDLEQRDVVAALDFVCAQPEVDPRRVALLGFSMGASAVAMVGARDARPRAVVLYATWSSLDDELQYKAGRLGPLSYGPVLLAVRWAGIAAENVRPIDWIAAVGPRPLLMIAGALDEDTPLPIMQRLFAAARAPKELWVNPRAAHGGHAEVAPAEYEARLVPFLERSL